jgi:SAM-dependent methyltransferase
MHDTAYELGRAFFSLYAKPNMTTALDIGAMDVNGTLRDFCPPGVKYIGVDIAPGKGVDQVIESARRLPFEDDSFDLAVSSSCLEHDPLFWVTFLELMRVIKPGGYAYISAPSNGQYHAYPLDCWRFYPDAGLALEQWARHSGNGAHLVESFTADRKRDQWNDFVMIFGKGELALPERFLSDATAGARNVRKAGQPELSNRSDLTEDQRIIRTLVGRLKEATAK